MSFEGFDIPADLDTPVSAFLKLADLRPRYLLESVEGGERVGRFSFLGFGDADEVRLRIERESIRKALDAAPRLAPALPGIPFCGGLVGAVAYGDAESVFLAPRSVLVFDHVSRRAALLHDGHESERRDLRAEILRALHGPIPASKAVAPVRADRITPSLDRASFLDAVLRAKAAIREGEVYQLVLSIRFRAPYDGDPFTLYRALRLLNPSPYTFFLRFSDVALVGSSPEALVKLSGRRAELRPIAGTRPRGADEAADAALEAELVADPKEAAEHVMLVDLARNDLGRVAVPGSIAIRPLRTVERYSHVMHLVSGVTGVLAPDRDALDLFESCFPAGTVTGAPKVRAMELISEIEPVPRGFYAGSVGYFGHGGAVDQAITIRTLWLSEGTVTFQAGAGIVADSDPEREHDEVLAKSQVLRSVLERASEVTG
jgi:anthranilate synthase component I